MANKSLLAVGDRRRVALANRSFGSKCVNISEWLLQDMGVEEHNGIKGLVLGRCRDVFRDGQVCQKALKLLFAGQVTGYVAKGVNVATQPKEVAILG